MNSPTITTRLAGIKDQGNVTALLTEAWIHSGYPRAALDTLRHEPFHPANVARTAANHAQDPDSFKKIWLAFVGTTPAGIIATEEIGGGVYTEPAFRNMGIAKTLITLRDAFLQERGRAFSIAYIEPSNTASLRLHKGLGFVFSRASQRRIDAAAAQGIDITKEKRKNGAHLLLRLLRPLSLSPLAPPENLP